MEKLRHKHYNIRLYDSILLKGYQVILFYVTVYYIYNYTYYHMYLYCVLFILYSVYRIRAADILHLTILIYNHDIVSIIDTMQ